MHFITGGACNGKRKWVKRHYTLDRFLWISAYDDEGMLEGFENTELPSTVILEGVETWIHKQLDTSTPPDMILKIFMQDIEPWLQWEEADRQRRIVIIGTDISKGIVPIDKHDRLWRDITGWAYQELVRQADRVDVIWYGIEQMIKNERER